MKAKQLSRFVHSLWQRVLFSLILSAVSKHHHIQDFWNEAVGTFEADLVVARLSGDEFYVVTAVRMDDKVELSLLRDMVYKDHDLPFGCTPSRLTMAPQAVAESLTGFQSGCMPPICHSTPMKLYIDRSIADAAHSNMTTASIGGGILGKRMLLPLPIP